MSAPAPAELWAPDKLNEKCAVVAVMDPNSAEMAALALRAMDHRGRDSTGIGGILPDGDFRVDRWRGAAKERYTPEVITELGRLGMTAVVGHNRYATSGAADKHGQPVRAGRGDSTILLAQNGNLSYLDPLEQYLTERGIDFSALNDTEMATEAVAHEIAQGKEPTDAMANIFPLLVGAHSTVFCVKDKHGNEVIGAVCDRHKIRPLALGKTKNGYMVASETVGLDAAGATFVRDIRPGELLTITRDRITHEDKLESRQLAEPKPRFDIFELIYFSDPESLFMGMKIGDIREAWGAELGREFINKFGPLKPNTLVVGMPSSGLRYARGFAEATGTDFDPTVVTKILQARGFMGANPKERHLIRDSKYLFNFKGKRLRKRPIVIVDDSIVRGDTAPHTNKVFTEAQKLKIGRFMISLPAFGQLFGKAKTPTISWAIGSPMLLHPNYYGVDIPNQEDLIAARHDSDLEGVRTEIDCDQLLYLPLNSMLKVLQRMTGVPPEHIEKSCFTGDYPVEIGKRAIKRFTPEPVAT